jgi:hypothetical protein
MATTGCGISHKDTKHADNCRRNKTKTKDNTTKPQTNNFSKYCEYNTKKFDIKYTHIVQGLYNKALGKNIFYTHYESFLNVRNSSTE